MSDDATEDVALTFGEEDLDPKRRRLRFVLKIDYLLCLHFAGKQQNMLPILSTLHITSVKHLSAAFKYIFFL